MKLIMSWSGVLITAENDGEKAVLTSLVSDLYASGQWNEDEEVMSFDGESLSFTTQ